MPMVSEPGFSVWLSVDGKMQHIFVGTDKAMAMRILAIINGPRLHPVAYLSLCSISRMADEASQ